MFEALSRHRLLIGGATLVILVALFGLVGQLLVPEEMAEVGAGRPAQKPSAEHWLGTDQQGRDVMADLIYGTPTSLEIGVIAGLVGVAVGALMGLIAGYAGGIVDEVIRIVMDVLLTIPGLMILIIVASMLGVV
ncbi:MAG: glutathione ABC transporter permease GsiD, partial [Caldilineaceae bacterium]|nr:glutathione ABC transporter permease GsiD [Caldilineaceae bacterium]